jgi:hypothetical protein
MVKWHLGTDFKANNCEVFPMSGFNNHQEKKMKAVRKIQGKNK